MIRSLVVQQEEQLLKLKLSQSMSRQELQDIAAESERLRQLMEAEQTNMKEALKQKKEINAHLRQSMLELRRESDSQALTYKQQTQLLRDQIQGLEMATERSKKELEKMRNKETLHDSSASMVRRSCCIIHDELTSCIMHVPFSLSTICIQLAVQVKELQNMLKVAESTIRQLHLDLQASHKELSILQDKDNLKIARDEMKITSLLSRITKFDSDLQLAR